MSKNHSNVDKSFGFEKINSLFENIKEALNTIAAKEYMLENPSIVISHDDSYSNFEEMELLIKAEISAFKNKMRSINFFKWALVLFESFGAYLAIGLVTHALNVQGWIDEEYYYVISIIQWLLSVTFSFAIVNFAIKTVKRKTPEDKVENKQFMIAFAAIMSLPLFNVMLIYGVNYEIDNKEIYFISLFFTLFTGTLLVLRSSSLSEKEAKRLQMLKKFKKSLEVRKKLYEKARILYLQIFTQNNKYEGFLENVDNIDNSNTLYAPLKRFLSQSSNEGFDKWSNNYIKIEKNKRSLNEDEIV